MQHKILAVYRKIWSVSKAANPPEFFLPKCFGQNFKTCVPCSTTANLLLHVHNGYGVALVAHDELIYRIAD